VARDVKTQSSHGAQSWFPRRDAGLRRSASVSGPRPPTLELWADSADVLIVDDDAELRSSLLELLQLQGYFAVAAANGQEALRMARIHCPRLILLDLQMPVMTGWQFLERRRCSDFLSSIPVILTTAERSGVPRAEAVAVVPKPIDEETLVATIASVLDPAAARTARS
jgi:CheY-like chemotaxis protein